MTIEKRVHRMDAIDAYPIPGFREPLSCFTHLVAVPVFAVWGCFLVRRGRGSWSRTASLAILVLSSLFLLSMSAGYHLLAPGAVRDVLGQLDVAAVFVLIAGTVTPVHTILFRGVDRWAPLMLFWSAAATGIALRTILSVNLPPGVGPALFLLMGWSGIISCIILWKRFGFQFVKPLLLGGVVYTAGVIVLVMNRPILIPGVIGAHELWHLAVLAGLSLHWRFIFSFAAGMPAAEARKSSVRSRSIRDPQAVVSDP